MLLQEAVGALRRGDCYAECNRRGVVLQVVNELHEAQFHAFLTLCRSKPGTHHAEHLSTVGAIKYIEMRSLRVNDVETCDMVGTN